MHAWSVVSPRAMCCRYRCSVPHAKATVEQPLSSAGYAASSPYTYPQMTATGRKCGQPGVRRASVGSAPAGEVRPPSSRTEFSPGRGIRVRNAERGSMSQEYFSRRDAAKYLGVSPDTLDRLRKSGRLSTYSNPETGTVRLKKSELDAVFVRDDEEDSEPALSYRAS